MGIVSIGCQLLKTVGLLAVRPDLAKLRWKNRKSMCIFNYEYNLNPDFNGRKFEYMLSSVAINLC